MCVCVEIHFSILKSLLEKRASGKEIYRISSNTYYDDLNPFVSVLDHPIAISIVIFVKK